ncbi:glycosyltransferase family 2 protein [Sulfitobacter sp. F26169L]|uniref:glycosyltransferase family 2 protein n=1 Tax=Sulfitobacter sp. F26169L TaxID=2996015 RepID=UPI0022608BD7|nr:glycosyltransferase family 2 protein [Sulfitobacter sp. F26169L]MCX7565436.1 glycosyltransferase family 2 protein [Sulfitobacter sp. F26169L]
MNFQTLAQNTNRKVAIVAAARNEAAYLADWIFHHLYFGFSPVLVYVNRSTDSSAEVVRRIAAVVPEVQLLSGDGFEGKNNVQLAAYGDARRRLRCGLTRQDYVHFADIDEFWTPANFDVPVQGVLESAGWPKIASFNWFQLLSDGEPFAPPMAQRQYGQHHHLVKTTIRQGLPVIRQSVHTVRTAWPMKRWSASGAHISSRTPYRTPNAPQSFGPAFILHRLFRSPIEYLAMLGRGRPAFQEKLFKDNRYGYRQLEGKAEPMRAFHIKSDTLAQYEEARIEFLGRTGIAELTVQTQQNVRREALQVLNQYQALSVEEKQRWSLQFRNLDLAGISESGGEKSGDPFARKIP